MGRLTMQNHGKWCV